jgi:hypothetical protein
VSFRSSREGTETEFTIRARNTRVFRVTGKGDGWLVRAGGTRRRSGVSGWWGWRFRKQISPKKEVAATILTRRGQRVVSPSPHCRRDSSRFLYDSRILNLDRRNTISTTNLRI